MTIHVVCIPLEDCMSSRTRIKAIVIMVRNLYDIDTSMVNQLKVDKHPLAAE